MRADSAFYLTRLYPMQNGALAQLASVVQALAGSGGWHVTVVQQDARFVRLTVVWGDLVLKIEMVNDVPAHVGELKRDPVLGLTSPGTLRTSGASAAGWACRATLRTAIGSLTT